jgi:hypothetical protein
MSLISKITRIFRKRGEETEETPDTKYDIDIRDYINKFVKQHDTDIGESVAFHDERIIVKNRDGFMAVPLFAVTDNSEKIIVGDFDRDEALILGKEWFERKDTLKFDENGMMIKEEAKE